MCCHCVRECVIGVVSLSGVLWCCVCCGVCVCVVVMGVVMWLFTGCVVMCMFFAVCFVDIGGGSCLW